MMKLTFKYTRKEFAALILFIREFDLNHFPSEKHENLMRSVGALVLQRFMILWEKRKEAKKSFNITFSDLEMNYLIYMLEIAIEFEPQEPEPLLQVLIDSMEQRMNLMKPMEQLS